jgi:hypothetical protein
MPEVHLPHLEDHEEPGGKSSRRFRIPKLLLEVILISSGVFLGLAGEQWRENSHKRELAESALRGFRRELETNRKAVAGVTSYHNAKWKELEEFLQSDPKQHSKTGVHLQGLKPAAFEHAVWDLTLATGSLANIDQPLAYSLAHLYNTQQSYGQLTQGMTQAMYVLTKNDRELLGAIDLYYGDLVIMEPKLLAMYHELIPRIDRLLKE